MTTQLFKKTILFYTLVISATANAGSNNSALKCLQLFETELLKISPIDKSFYPRNLPTAPVDFESTKSFLGEKLRAESFGQVRAVFSKKYDTQIYYAATALPDKDGVIPMIDPQSKVVYILLHGGGTAKGGGANWRDVINFVADIGESAISPDLPGHGQGSLSESQTGVGTLMWLRELVTEAKSSGKKVNLVGHSFGSNIIEKYIRLYPTGPYAVDGALLISWIPTVPEMQYWQTNVMPRMKFNKEMIVNPYAGFTLDRFFKETENLKFESKLADPTLINPGMSVRSLVGAKEEYFEAPLAGKSQAPSGPNTFDVIPRYKETLSQGAHIKALDAGHAIFNSRDENGAKSVESQILAVAGLQWKDKDVKYVSRPEGIPSPAEQLASMYKADSNFKAWFIAKYGESKTKQNKQEKVVLALVPYNTPAQKIISEYEAFSYDRILKSKQGSMKDLRASYEKAAHKYATDLRFQSWADQKFGKAKVLNWYKQKDEFMSSKILVEYEEAYQARIEDIFKEIRQTQYTHPDFYKRHLAGKIKTVDVPASVSKQDTLKWLYENNSEFKTWAVKRYGDKKIYSLISSGDFAKTQPIVDDYKQILEKSNNLRDDSLLNAYYLEIIRGNHDGTNFAPSSAD